MFWGSGLEDGPCLFQSCSPCAQAGFTIHQFPVNAIAVAQVQCLADLGGYDYATIRGNFGG